ncbi:MLO-like protein 5 [Morus notabilis]|uniref:MLO-like protein n=1 Tax=Morus notabilis TaxID=981085 RepID=W9RJ18_9ROSA|nr:MLO-like protein 5 [Morus notabilis]
MEEKKEAEKAQKKQLPHRSVWPPSRCSIVVSIPACHAGDPGSIPGNGCLLEMGGGGGDTKTRELDQTPTWAVASVCAVIIVISIILEKVLHLVGEWFQERKKKALFEALQKVKGELMVLGFISLLMTFGQNYIVRICIPMKIADTMLPCPLTGSDHNYESGHETEVTGGDHEHHRKLLWYERRFLAAGSVGADCKLGHVPLISLNGLHQLHIFIFFLALFHVIYSAMTMTLGRLKIRGWKVWERETAHHQEFMNDPSKFRLTHETSFVKDHTRFWTKTPVTFYGVCFLRQFFRSVTKADYLTMRHGFVTVHLAPGSKFDFQKYIKRSLEDDFKVVVGISNIFLRIQAVNSPTNVKDDSAVHYYGLQWCSFCFSTFTVTLAVGTKLQGIITQMALEIQERHAVVQGIPLMGSTMKKSIFDEQTSKALKKWHKNAVKKKDEKVPTRVLGGSPGESPVHSPTHPQGRSQPPAANIMASVDVELHPPNSSHNYGHPDLL